MAEGGGLGWCWEASPKWEAIPDLFCLTGYVEVQRGKERQTPNRPQPTEGRTLTFPLIIPEASLPFKRFS